MRNLGLVTALAAIGAIALAACGSSGPSAEDEVRAAAIRAGETTNAKAFCRRMVSERFLAEVIRGDAADCEKASVLADDPGETRVAAVTLRGADEERALVAVSVEGGEADGTQGHLEMVQQGDRWLLDRYRDDFLRSNFLAAIAQTDEGAFSNQRMKDCMSKQVKKVSATEVRKFTYDATVDSERLVADLLPLAEECPQALAEYGADEFTAGLVEAGQTPAFVHCVHEELEALLLLTDITPELLGENPGFAVVAALEGIAAGAKKNCKGSG